MVRSELDFHVLACTKSDLDGSECSRVYLQMQQHSIPQAFCPRVPVTSILSLDQNLFLRKSKAFKK